jgi:hypothetical protein
MYTKIIGIAPIYFKTSYNLNMAGALWLWLMLGGGGINWLLSR